MAESLPGTLYATPGAVITDAQGNAWSIQNGQVVKNGVADPLTANVTAIAYESGQLWQENASKLWWAATGAGWSPTYGTPVAPVPASPSGAVITPGNPTPILDASGNIWTISNGQVVENGVADPLTANVIAMAYESGQVWQENASKLWWQATGAGWSPTYGTPVAPVPASPSGTVITSGNPTPILDASGNIWTISNGQVVENGVADPLTANVIEMVYQGGQVWQENVSRLWWSYSQAADGSTVWTPGSGPAVARTWIGGGDNSASNPNDWTPAGVPARGDTLTITSGTINVSDNALAGDTLTVPAPSGLGTSAFKPFTPTINLIKANASIATGGPGNTVAINVSGGTSTLSLNSFATTVNVKVASGSTLVMNDNVSLSTLNVSGGTISFIGDNNFGAFKTVFNDRLVGTATINEFGGNASGETMEVNGFVGSGLTFNLDSVGPRDVGLQIDHPDEFHGAISRMDGYVAFMGLHATSGEILNGMLELFDGGKLVNATRFTGPTGPDPYGDVLQLQQNSAGVMLSRGIGHNYQPGGNGTVLPLSPQS